MNYLEIETIGINKDGEEKKYKLKDFNGKKTILYFYPEDDTPVCSEEAHKFKDFLKKAEKKLNIIGVSKDTPESHKEFIKKHGLNFTLLSDVENKLKEAIKEHKKDVHDIKRTTFILDENGEIIKYWEKVDVDGHIEEIEEFLKTDLEKE